MVDENPAQWLTTLINDLADPSTAADARARIKNILLRAVALRGVSQSPLDRDLAKLQKAISALKSGELIDDLIVESGPGGLTRVAELYDSSAARISGWRKSAPAGVDEITLLKVLWLLASSVNEPEQAYQADDLGNPSANEVFRKAETLRDTMPMHGNMTLAMYKFLYNYRASKMSNTVPIKIVIAAQSFEIPGLRKDAVPPQIPFGSRIVFMGEAPGAAETISGLPFVGPSGRLLRETIEKICEKENFDTEKIGFTNVFQDRPTGNKVSEFFGSAKKEDTVPSLPPCAYGHLLTCQLPALQLNAKELSEKKPVVIVALGAIAAWALLGRYDIRNFRGEFTSIDYGTFQTNVIATYHPAYVLRDGQRLDVFKSDIMAAIEKAKESD